MFNRLRCRLLSPSLLLIAILSVGCGAAETGPKRYDFSGKVTYGGKPVPRGSITFDPDRAKNNSGPSSVVPIVNGAFKTEHGAGLLGGSYVARIDGYDGVVQKLDDGTENPDGSPLFKLTVIEFEMPKETSSKDFDVPVAEAKKKR